MDNFAIDSNNAIFNVGNPFYAGFAMMDAFVGFAAIALTVAVGCDGYDEIESFRIIELTFFKKRIDYFLNLGLLILS